MEKNLNLFSYKEKNVISKDMTTLILASDNPIRLPLAIKVI